MLHAAAGVADNRLQNVVITLDKIKLCLERPGSSLPEHLINDIACFGINSFLTHVFLSIYLTPKGSCI